MQNVARELMKGKVAMVSMRPDVANAGGMAVWNLGGFQLQFEHEKSQNEKVTNLVIRCFFFLK